MHIENTLETREESWFQKWIHREWITSNDLALSLRGMNEQYSFLHGSVRTYEESMLCSWASQSQFFYLENISIRPKRKGIGTKLIAILIEELRQKNISLISWVGNHQSLPFFARLFGKNSMKFYKSFEWPYNEIPDIPIDQYLKLNEVPFGVYIDEFNLHNLYIHEKIHTILS